LIGRFGDVGYVRFCGDEDCPGHETDYGRVEVFLTPDGESVVSWLTPWPAISVISATQLS
jgi:hypothetical protein